MPSEKDIHEERFEREFNAWLQTLESEIQATRKTEQITAEDLSIIVR